MTIQARFEEFHRTHPEVYNSLVSYARQLKSRHRSHIGMKMLFEVLRWDFYMSADKHAVFLLNNNYHSRYARLIMEREPDLDGFFYTRKTHTP